MSATKENLKGNNDSQGKDTRKPSQSQVRLVFKPGYHKRIQQIRLAAGLSVDEYAARTGYNQSTIVYYESGCGYMSDHYIKKAVVELGANPDWIMYGIGAMHRNPVKFSLEKRDFLPARVYTQALAVISAIKDRLETEKGNQDEASRRLIADLGSMVANVNRILYDANIHEAEAAYIYNSGKDKAGREGGMA